MIAAQFPQWAHLPIVSVTHSGTDNAIFRLGDDLAVRLPRVPSAVSQVAKEQRWLPQLARLLPLTIPVPIGNGVPTAEFPWPWFVYHWITGENAVAERIDDPFEAAATLGKFVAALRCIDSTNGPFPGEHNFFRGVPLQDRDMETRSALKSLKGIIDVGSVTSAWKAALEVPVMAGRPTWIHGDLHVGNLLACNGKLRAVIDFGGLGVGDPACDVMVAWTYLSAGTRKAFRAAAQVDDAIWARGRGWALSFALIALPYYLNSNPELVAIARHAIKEVLADQQGL